MRAMKLRRMGYEVQRATMVPVPALLAALKACGAAKELDLGSKLHQDAVRSEIDTDIFVASTLVDMYAKCGSLVDAQKVFDQMEIRNVVSWTALILGYVGKGESESALQIFTRMRGPRGCVPNARTYVAALMACIGLAEKEEAALQADGQVLKMRSLMIGWEVHSQTTSSGCDSDIFVCNTLVDMYGKCGSLKDAQKVFDGMSRRNVVSWTTMILGFVENGRSELGLATYERMHAEGCEADARIFVAALRACSALAALEAGEACEGNNRVVKRVCLEKGRTIHSRAAACICCFSNIFIGSTLVDMYGKCGSMGEARMIFDKMKTHDLVSWTALILGYAENGEAELALKLFKDMQRLGCVPDARTYVAALVGCGNLAALETGRRIHCEIRRRGLKTDAVLENCLVDFYGKCGSMRDAEKVFEGMSSSSRSLVTWSALIAGYSRQGDAEAVFKLFDRMKELHLQPNGITFLSILTVCSHTGLVEKGRELFEVMFAEFGIAPELEHYHCVIDLLGRANRMEEVLKMANTMPYKPTVVTWKTVLGACKKWKNLEVGRIVFDKLIRLDPKQDAAYLLMASLCGSAGLWEEQSRIVEMRRFAQTWKKQGQSWWTDDEGTVHSFKVGDQKHPQIEEIHKQLKVLLVRMKEIGYVAELTSIQHNICDRDKQDEVLWEHSERLAIGCALINTSPGREVRIVKNLRVCDDCHLATIFMSKIEKRRFVCRDASRFHVFEDGKCSCGGFW